MSRIIAFILAGGKGARMDILCQVRSKPALPFAGKFRVIDFSLSNCINSQIKNIGVFVDYQRSQLINYLKQWQNENLIKSTIEILGPEENGFFSGTANAIYQRLDYLRGQSADRILVIPSDQIYKMDFRKMLAFHEKSKADVTIGVISVPIEEANRFGTLELDEKGRVIEFLEKPDVPKSNLVSMGIYIFDKDILIKRLIEDAAKPASLHDFGYSIIPEMVSNDNVYAYEFEDFWRDIGTVDAYYNTNMELLNSKTTFNFDGGWPILTCANYTTLKRFPNSSIENSVISPGCVIKGKVENSILSPGVYVGEQAIVRNSILLPDVFVGFHSIVESSIIDEVADIGEFCYIGFNSDHNQMTEHTIIGKGAVIAAHTAIARGYKILPYASTGEFAGSVLIKNYRDEETVQPSQNQWDKTKVALND